MVCLERNLKADEKRARRQRGGRSGVANVDSASKKGEHGFLSTHPQEAAVSSLARQEARRMSTAV